MTPLSSLIALSKCSMPRISICLLMNSFVKLGIYNISMTLRPRFLKSFSINSSACLSFIFIPIFIFLMPLSFCFFAMTPYSGPRLAPMSKMSLYGSRHTSQLIPLTTWYCHSLFILLTSFIDHGYEPPQHSLLQLNSTYFEFLKYIQQHRVLHQNRHHALTQIELNF